MTHLNYRKKRLGTKELEYMFGTAIVDGVEFKDAWLIRTGKKGLIKRDLIRDGYFVVRGDTVVSETVRGHVKLRRKTA